MDERRVNMYRLLGRLYKKEVDGKLLTALSSMAFPGGGDSEDGKGFSLIGTFLSSAQTRKPDEIEEDLAVDFAKTFLAAGIAKGEAAFPYESVYTSKKKIVMQEAWEKVRKIYASREIRIVDEGKEFLEDHIACELEYMAILCSENAPVSEQLQFLETHLLNWIPAFTADVEHYSNSDFYKGLAVLTRGFLAGECERLQAKLA